SSVVHTGVKSFGCENRTAHESPIQSWKLIRPSVVSASKSGASAPKRNDISAPPVVLKRATAWSGGGRLVGAVDRQPRLGPGHQPPAQLLDPLVAHLRQRLG